MSIAKPVIRQVSERADPSVRLAIEEIRENIEVLTGRRGGAIPALPVIAMSTTADAIKQIQIIAQWINAYVARINS